MCDKIINHKENIVQHKEIHRSISKYSCIKCKKYFKFIYFMCFPKVDLQ